MASFWADWAFWLYFAAWLPYALLAVVYGFGSPWYGSAIGRSLLLSKVAIVAVLSNVLAAYMFGDYAGRDSLRVFSISLVVVAGFYQFFTILREQQTDRRAASCPELQGDPK